MKVVGATDEQIYAAAEETGVRIYNLRPAGHGFAFTLKTGEPAECRYDWRGKVKMMPRHQRLSQHERRSTARESEGVRFHPVVPGAVCWHGHRDFFRALYRRAPKAVIWTALATYRNAENFEDQFPETRYQEGHVGAYTTPYADACTCGEEEGAPTESTDYNPYRPTTGQPCTCRPGRERDNCTSCEGTGQRIDFARIRAAHSSKGVAK